MDDIQVINPLFADFVSQTYKDICIFNNIISQYTDGTDKSPQWSFFSHIQSKKDQHTHIYIYILGQNGIFYMELRKKL